MKSVFESVFCFIIVKIIIKFALVNVQNVKSTFLFHFIATKWPLN